MLPSRLVDSLDAVSTGIRDRGKTIFSARLTSTPSLRSSHTPFIPGRRPLLFVDRRAPRRHLLPSRRAIYTAASGLVSFFCQIFSDDRKQFFLLKKKVRRVIHSYKRYALEKGDGPLKLFHQPPRLLVQTGKHPTPSREHKFDWSLRRGVLVLISVAWYRAKGEISCSVVPAFLNHPLRTPPRHTPFTIRFHSCFDDRPLATGDLSSFVHSDTSITLVQSTQKSDGVSRSVAFKRHTPSDPCPQTEAPVNYSIRSITLNCLRLRTGSCERLFSRSMLSLTPLSRTVHVLTFLPQ